MTLQTGTNTQGGYYVGQDRPIPALSDPPHALSDVATPTACAEYYFMFDAVRQTLIMKPNEQYG